jgi:hypothetical protein
MVLSFELPFALIPLLKFCNSSNKVGPLKESIYVRNRPVTLEPFFTNAYAFLISKSSSRKNARANRKLNSDAMHIYIWVSLQTVVIAWALSFALIVVNTYFLVWTYVDWLVHSRLPKYATALLSVAVLALMAAYLAFVVYLAFRRDAVRTYVPVSERAEDGSGSQAVAAAASADDADMPAPFRKDLADAST